MNRTSVVLQFLVSCVLREVMVGELYDIRSIFFKLTFTMNLHANPTSSGIVRLI
jgi:hypothetical protein